MTAAAVKKLALQLPLKQRLAVADAIYDSVPVLRGSVGIEELERRADEVLSGKVKAVSWDEFQQDLDAMRKTVKSVRAIEASSQARKTPKSTARRRA
jgi:putative addiction module component (TIGR02574 family)